jgi:hypothetical protein
MLREDPEITPDIFTHCKRAARIRRLASRPFLVIGKEFYRLDALRRDHSLDSAMYAFQQGTTLIMKAMKISTAMAIAYITYIAYE